MPLETFFSNFFGDVFPQVKSSSDWFDLEDISALNGLRGCGPGQGSPSPASRAVGILTLLRRSGRETGSQSCTLLPCIVVNQQLSWCGTRAKVVLSQVVAPCETLDLKLRSPLELQVLCSHRAWLPLHTHLMAGDSLPIPEAFVRTAGAGEPQGRILCRGAKLRTRGRWVDVCGCGLPAGREEETVPTRERVCLPSPWSVSSSFPQKVRPRDKLLLCGWHGAGTHCCCRGW